MINRFVFFVLGITLLSACGGGGGNSPTSPSGGDNNNTPVTLSVSADTLSFSARRNDMPTPAAQTVTVSWDHSDIADILSDFQTGTTPSWMTVTRSGDSSPITLEFRPASTDLDPDSYTAKFIIVARDAKTTALVRKEIDITYHVMSSAATKRATADKILHFGQEIVLNGANIAWSHNDWYNTEIGTADMNGEPRTNITAFQNHFEAIKNAGGNSARIWLHTGATVTPAIEANGTVSSLSRELTDAQVVSQLDAILDAAWDADILVTFNLFSFNMVCDAFTPTRAKAMLETQFQTYVDNALTPMVSGVKDHPAMFAWEIFNEPEGMSRPNFFCPSTETVSTETVQSVVNQAAAAIHAADPNVKVATSAHTDLYDQYSNATLTSIPNANPGGTLDFYALHWYDTGWQVSPHIVPASDFSADRPIIVGEYDVENTGANGPDGEDSIRTLLANGYQGAWPWALTTGDAALITSAITEATSLSGTLDKAAIESCIQDKPDSCYNGPL